MTDLAIFEVGSLVCGATPSSVGLIFGRLIAGIGSGGLFTGVSVTEKRNMADTDKSSTQALLMIANTVPLAKRPIYNGIFGGMYAVASIAGPL